MRNITATCTTTGQQVQNIKPSQLKLIHYNTINKTEYLFQCPQCHQPHQHEIINPAITDQLNKLKIDTITINKPAEIDEIKLGPPIDHDDAIDLHRILVSTDTISDLIGEQ